MWGQPPATSARGRRRSIDTAATVLVLALLLAGCGVLPGSGIAAPEFGNPLRIPELLEGSVSGDGRRSFDLDVTERQFDFGQGGPSSTIGINSNYLGPTLRMTRGDTVNMNVQNSLQELTTLHWHGMHVPARADGGPHQLIDPGDTWSPSWTIDQAPATLWYHSHPHGETAQQVYRGAAGMLLIEDPNQGDLGLPDEYGVDDVPVIVQDKSFTSDGQQIVDPEGTASTGFLGDTIVVNGTYGPVFDVTTQKIRLRLLNASNARVYNFGFDDDREFEMIAGDGGYLDAPLRTDRVQLSPAERAEIVVTVRPGEEVQLTSYPPDLGVNPSRYGTGTVGVLQLRARETLAPSADIAEELPQDPPLSPSDAAGTRRFRISGLAINGRPMQMNRIDDTVTVDDIEIWEIANRDPQPHNFHVHDVQFRILDIDGEPPGPALSGPKDTVYVPPQRTVRILLQFSDYTDPQWPYMYHCHLLWHEDLGIMGQFVVVRPGQSADPQALHNHT